MVSPWWMALMGHTGSQTSQLTQSSLIFRDIVFLESAWPLLQPRASASLRFDEHVVHAGRRDRRLDAFAVGGLADEEHLDALHRVRLDVGERRGDQVGHAVGCRRNEA